MASSRLTRLAELGQSAWLDDLSRDLLESGKLEQLVRDGVRGVTSNPATFEKAISRGTAYDGQLREGARAGLSTSQLYRELTTRDVRNACDLLRPVYDTTSGLDGYVSLEVSPHLAHDAEASISEARELAAAVDRPNLMVKIPGTEAGLIAIEELLFRGINVNVTLLFSIDRYRAVLESYLKALERRLEAGSSVRDVASVASFFLSRIDVLVDELLAHRMQPGGESPLEPHPAELRGQAAVANAKAAHAVLRRSLRGERWQALDRDGARVQRLLWASTGTKDPRYSDVKYVEPLIGPHTVTTMPLATLEAFEDHGTVKTTLGKQVTAARGTIRDLRELGIDLRQVAWQLENEGVQKFIVPFDRSLKDIEAKRAPCAAQQDLDGLEARALQLRRDVITMTTAAGSGHPSSCLSAADLVAALYFAQMRWDPAVPEARDVDTFMLSKGHAAPLLWAALHRAGAIDEDIATLRKLDSTLEGHPTPTNPWVKVATGSLGQGLAAANGIAIANRLDGIDARVYCLLGDGECSEGSVWEAAQFTALHGLTGVVAIVDQNGLAQSGPAPYGHRSDVFADRFRAFGWSAIEIDGHDVGQIRRALTEAVHSGPTAIIAHTVKGQGVSFLAGRQGWHGKALDREECERALAELGEPGEGTPIDPRRVPSREVRSTEQRPNGGVTPRYEAGARVATRDAFGHALNALGAQLPQIVVLDGDVKNSTRTEEFEQSYPGRFIENSIAEQNMVGAATGLAACGKLPVVATFACFLTRAADFIRMASHSRPRQMIFCGSHAGVSIGEDGPSQMGLEDIAMFRALHDSTVLHPCDAVSTERLLDEATRTPGIVYLRTLRSGTPVLYENAESFPIGGSKTLRSSEADDVTLVAAGVTVPEALEAADRLAERGVTARVIDAYSIKPIDAGTLQAAARETSRVFAIEDHWVDGGLGDAVTNAVGHLAPVTRLGVSVEPRSGTTAELLDLCGISAAAITSTVLSQTAAG